MTTVTPICRHLPAPRPRMDWRDLRAHGSGRGSEFYLTALAYAHYLWRHGRAARAVLCLDRAFGADLRGDESVLRTWPLPYAALAWLLAHTPAGVFLGNPRVHFQHLAHRVNAPRREQRCWRAWACWAIARRILPRLPGDPRHRVKGPATGEIAARLTRHGHAAEQELWRRVLKRCAPARPH